MTTVLLLLIAGWLPLAPSWTWLDPLTHDFGDIPKNVEVSFTFRFKNTGTEPMLIDNVRTTCGCTAPDWLDRPIAPGETGLINIQYDARDDGYFYKMIKVYFHGRRKAEKLYIEGVVIP